MTDPSDVDRDAAPAASSGGTPEEAAASAVDLVSALSQMSGLVLSRETVDTALHLVTKLAATVTAGTLGAGVTIVDAQGTRSRAASNQITEEVDALQYQLDEGPCLTAFRSRTVIRIDDTTSDDRWPRWSPAAAQLGVRSVLSAPLIAGHEAIGAMKIYCQRLTSYSPHDEHVMRLLAAQAAILLANSQSLHDARTRGRQLTEALSDRDAVVRATGVLMARGAVDQRAAFAALTATAREAGRPVTEVAHAVLAALNTRRTRASDDGTLPA